MIILAVETSCDDTAVALLDIRKSQVKILADFVSSQIKIHAPFGGVVPNLAARAHYKNLPILLEKTLDKIDPRKIDLIAVAIGPGLEPSLWAGVNAARVLALAMKKPIVGVNHLEGHIAANFIGGNPKSEILNPKQIQISKIQKLKSIFPAICLIVSGGHTQIVLINKIGDYKVIGQTRDDAAGEAFDKVAKLFGLGYPGGPEIALKAKNGRSDAFGLPRPMIDVPNYEFSFSGLKTAVLYLVRDLGVSAARQHLPGDLNPPTRQVARQMPARLQSGTINDLCASFQQAVIDVLVHKTIRAAIQYKAKAVMISGGVAANKELRKQTASAVQKNIPGSCSRLRGTCSFLFPDLKYCTDNAAMIGLAGYWKYARSGGDKLKNIVARANLNL